MDNFKLKFVEEANDHVLDLEKAVLALDGDVENKDLIEQIFRAMHSLKGGGAMFGFDKISEFTHNLETIYDYVRNGKLEISKELLSATLASVDHIKLLLETQDEDFNGQVLEAHKNLENEIKSILSGLSGNEQVIFNNKNIELKNTEGINTYYIHFVPNNDIFDNGTNPLFLIDELYILGDVRIIPNVSAIPDFDGFNPLKCYISWEIILATKENEETVRDVFLFVESDCKLEIKQISSHNLLENRNFNSFLNDISLSEKEIGLNEILNIVEKFEQPVSSKVKKAIVNRNNITSKDNSISSLRVASEKLDGLMNLVSELVTTQARLQLFSEQNSGTELNSISENVQKLTRQLRDITFSIVLIPVETMITRFQRLVRDLSAELKKEIRFVAEGTDTELDKTIIENLTDPLLHLLRNCIDHGIELPEEREKKGKPREGTIIFKSYYSGANVHIQVTDDGAGIDVDFIRSKAIAKGLIAADPVLSKREILNLIFLPGFSTARVVTDVSGRGVGMDVVKKKITGIRGDVEVESKVNEGTSITIKLPLTLSIIDGLLVKIDKTFFVLPVTVVEKIYAVDHNKLSRAFNNIIVLDGKQFPFFNLRNEFGLSGFGGANEQLVILKYLDKQVGFTVDEVIGEYQAVLKPLGKHYKHQEIISGATILGDGTIALVIDTNKAIRFFSNSKIMVEE